MPSNGWRRTEATKSAVRSMQLEVKECNEKNGWYDDDRTFGDSLMLIVTEVAEAMEAFRENGFRESVRYPDWVLVGYVTVAKGCQEDVARKEKLDVGKPEGVASELADVLVRLLDVAERCNVDLYEEFRAKMDYNWTRSYRHGNKKL